MADSGGGRAARQAGVLNLENAEVEITACVTVPQLRGRGIYPAANRRIWREAAALSIRRIYMNTMLKNTASQRVIEKEGLRFLSLLDPVRIHSVHRAIQNLK